MKNECFKVVTFEGKKMVSYRIGQVNYELRSLQVTYEIGKETKAPVGFLFTFQDFDSAKYFAHEYSRESNGYAILRCQGFVRARKKVRIQWIGGELERVLELWKAYYTKYYTAQTACDIPKGTVCYKKVIPLEVVESKGGTTI